MCCRYQLKHVSRPLLLLILLQTVLGLSLCLADGVHTWRQTGGPPGSKINIITIDSTRLHVLYAGTSAGLFHSSDGGDSWHKALEQGLASQEVQSIAIAPLIPDLVYAGTHKGQVFRSTDAGISWTASAEGLPDRIIWSLVVHPLTPTLLFAGSDALYCSEDGGRRWAPLDLPHPSVRITALAIHPSLPSNLYVGTEKGILISGDTGRTWQEPGQGWPSETSIEALIVVPLSKDSAQLSICAGTEKGIYRSTDNGRSWQAPAHGVGENLVGSFAYCPTLSALYAGVSGRGIARSDDGGETWQIIAAEPFIATVSALAINPEKPNLIYAGTRADIYRSSDTGLTWEPAHDGLVGTDVYGLASLSGRGRLLSSTPWGIYRSEDAGKTWQVASSETGINALSMIVVAPHTVYAGTWNGRVYRSDDDGKVWKLVCNDVASGVPITTLAADPAAADSIVYAGTEGEGVFWSSDAGRTWQPMSEGLLNKHLRKLSMSTWRGKKLYAGTQSGVFVLDLSRYLASQAMAWQRVRALPTDEIRDIATGEDSATIYVAISNQLFRSSDGGQAWREVGRRSLAEHDVDIQAVALPAQDKKGDTVYLGTDRGVLVSHDGGQTWAFAVKDLWVNALLAESGNPCVLYAGVRSGGVWTGTDRLLGQPWTRQFLLWLPLGLVGALLVGVVSVLAIKRLSRPKVRLPVESLERNWSAWDRQIKEALMRHGQARFEVLSAIPADLRPAAMQCYPEVHPEEDLIWNPSPPTIELAESRRVQTFLRNWQAAQERLNDASAFRAAVSRLTDQLCNFLGFSRLASRTYKNLHGFVVEGPALRLRIPSRFPIIYMRKTRFGPEDIQDLRALMDILHMTSYLALVVVFGNEFLGPTQSDELKRLARSAAHDFVVLDFQDLFDIVIAKRREQQLTRLLLQQMDLTVVSPYVIYGPVPENMLFGRDNEVKTITRTIQDQSFAILGGRKIGKTSMLMQVNRLLLNTPGHVPFYLDCQAVQDYESFCEAIRSKWQVDIRPPFTPETFQQVVACLRRDGDQGTRNLVVLLDEVDNLLSYDMANQERLFRVFRALSQENLCRFVFCGERILHAGLQNPNSPLFNFCHVLRLGYLTPEDTRQIILEPMGEMGILIEEPNDLVNDIISLSSCHPNIVQYLCQQLLAQIGDRKPRTITLQDLDLVSRSRYFAEYFLAVIWGSATPLERIITLLMIEHPLVTVSEVADILREHGVEVPRETVEEALENLVLCSVLDREREHYAFAAHSFPDVVEASQDIPILLESLRHQLAVPPSRPVEGGSDAGSHLQD